MRNKGFFWFLTILLTIICVYQLSFTWVANNVEKKSEKEARARVAEMIEEAKMTDNKVILPNSLVEVDFNDPESEEIAVADLINLKLKEQADKPVFPIFGSTFKETKSRSLAFGLDLVGGMSVTMEVSIPDMVRTLAKNERDQEFKRAFEAAKADYEQLGGDFIEIFAAKHNSLNKGSSLVSLFSFSDIEELGMKSTDLEVIDFLKDREEKSMAGVEEIMNRRINQFGVAQPNIQIDPDNNRIYIELPGVQDEATVAAKLKSTANLQFYETWRLQEIQGAWAQAHQLSLTPYTESSIEDVLEDEVIADSSEIVSNESDTASVDESLDELDLDDLSSLGEGEDSEKGLASLAQPYGEQLFVRIENKGAVDQLLKRPDIKSKWPQTLSFMWGAESVQAGENKETGYVLYAIKIPADGKAKVGGKDVKRADAGIDPETGERTVDIQMSEEGDAKWGQMTTANVGNIVAITMDSVVYSAPLVNEPIKGGRTQISGTFTIDEAKDLAGLLNGGALPAPCVIKEQTRVGPTIGAENSAAGLMSFGIALLLVFVYMIFYYGKAGIVADIALFANILFIFGSLASFGAVLTLAGIAGIVLTIGMAVDANVLIFERIREEQASGKDVKSAIETGFKKALSSIIDANVTTLLTAVVLKSFGTGAIESFATTLIIGIFTSVFAALVITRLCITWWMNKGKSINFESKMTKNALKGFNINFVGKRKRFYLVSSVLVLGSIAMLATKSLSPSVEFSGGRTFGVKFENEAGSKKDLIESNLNKVLIEEDGKVASSSIKTKGNNYFLEITTNFMQDSDSSSVVQEKVEEGLRLAEAEVGTFKVQETRTVSDKIASELGESSLLAIVLSLVIIFGYILLRFGRWQYSTGAIIAMMHDVLIVLGIFSAFHGILPFNMDIDQAFIAAILTVIGYSINDTVIVFDRIRENLRLHKKANENEQINKSLNSTLSRTINTSMTTFIVLLIIFIFGGAAIKGFIFALMIGVIVGTYSSVCIATPILIDFSRKSKDGLKEKEIEKVSVAEA